MVVSGWRTTYPIPDESVIQMMIETSATKFRRENFNACGIHLHDIDNTCKEDNLIPQHNTLWVQEVPLEGSLDVAIGLLLG